MKLKTLLVIYAVVSLILGLGLLLVPNMVLSSYGTAPDDIALLQTQFLGGLILSLAVMAWFARNAGPSDARNAILLAVCLSEAIGLVVALLALSSGVLPPTGWGNVAIFLVFALAFGYARFVNPGGG
jgi:hypothetical protein